MIEMLWLVVVINAQGVPVPVPIPETTTFETMEACEEFGHDMTPRLEDWAKGYLRLDWDAPLQSTFRCEPAGDPA